MKKLALVLALLIASKGAVSAQEPRLTISVTRKGGGPTKVAARPDGTLVVAGDFYWSSNGPPDAIVVLDSQGKTLQRLPQLVFVPDPKHPESNDATLGLEIALPDGSFILRSGGNRLLRRLPDGTFDVDFNTRFAATGGSNGVFSATLEPGGTILASGIFDDLPLQRVAPDGSIDKAFRTQMAKQSLLEEGSSVSPYPDGRLLLNTVSRIGGGWIRELVRLLPDGSRDASFQPLDPGFIHFGGDWRALPDGRAMGMSYFCFGETEVPIIENVERFGLARLNSDGKLDKNFNLVPAEILEAHPPVHLHSPCLRVIAPLTDGKVYLALDWGREPDWSRSHGSIHRVLADGHLDPSFRCQLDAHYVLQLLPLPDGKLLVVDKQSDVWDDWQGGRVQSSLKRLNSDGTLDVAFDAGALEQRPFEILWTFVSFENLQPDLVYDLEASTNLRDWKSIRVISQPSGSGWFNDADANSIPAQFYRLKGQ